MQRDPGIREPTLRIRDRSFGGDETGPRIEIGDVTPHALAEALNLEVERCTRVLALLEQHFVAAPLIRQVDQSCLHVLYGGEQRSGEGGNLLLVLRRSDAHVGAEPSAREDGGQQAADEVREVLIDVENVLHATALESTGCADRDAREELRFPRAAAIPRRVQPPSRRPHVGTLFEQPHRDCGRDIGEQYLGRIGPSEDRSQSVRIPAQQHSQAAAGVLELRLEHWDTRLCLTEELPNGVQLEGRHQATQVAALGDFGALAQDVGILARERNLSLEIADFEVRADRGGGDAQTHGFEVVTGGLVVPDRRARIVAQLSPHIELVRQSERHRIRGELEAVELRTAGPIPTAADGSSDAGIRR
jgi:hypothetical protein